MYKGATGVKDRGRPADSLSADGPRCVCRSRTSGWARSAHFESKVHSRVEEWVELGRGHVPPSSVPRTGSSSLASRPIKGAHSSGRVRNLNIYAHAYGPNYKKLRRLLEVAGGPGHATANVSGGGRIRTSEGGANRFTAGPLWPLGNSPGVAHSSHAWIHDPRATCRYAERPWTSTRTSGQRSSTAAATST